MSPFSILPGASVARSVFSDGFSGTAVTGGAGLSADAGNVLFEGVDGGAMLAGVTISNALDTTLGSADWRTPGDGSALTAVTGTRGDLAVGTAPAGIDAVRTTGYSAAGDGGAALYVRAASEPAHPGKVQSADGAWWELAPAGGIVDARALGYVVGGGDQATAVADALAAATALSAALYVPSGAAEPEDARSLLTRGQADGRFVPVGPLPDPSLAPADFATIPRNVLISGGGAVSPDGDGLPYLTIDASDVANVDNWPDAWVFIRSQSAERDNGATVTIQRLADVAQGQTNPSALNVQTFVKDPADGAITYSGNFAVYTESQTGTGGALSAGVVGTCFKEPGSAQPGFGSSFQVRDKTGDEGENATACVGSEINIAATGADKAANLTNAGYALGLRRVVDILAKQESTVAGGADAHIGTGVAIRSDGGSAATIDTALAIYDSPGNPNPINNGVVVDTAGVSAYRAYGTQTAHFWSFGAPAHGIILDGDYTGSAIRVRGGEKIALEQSAAIAVRYTGGDVVFENAGDPRAVIDIANGAATSSDAEVITRLKGDARYARLAAVSAETASRSLTKAGGDANTVFRADSASAVTLTVEAGFAAADMLVVRQVGAGSVTIAEGAGVTVNPPRGGTLETAGAGATVTLICAGGDVWDMSGDTVAA